MEEERKDGLEWYPIYVSETATSVRYVLAEDAADAEGKFWDAYGEDGAFRDAVDMEPQFTCSIERADETAGAVALGIWRDIASRCASEMRLPAISSAGVRGPHSHSGITVIPEWPARLRESACQPVRIIEAGAALHALGHSDPSGAPGGFSRIRERTGEAEKTDAARPAYGGTHRSPRMARRAARRPWEALAASAGIIMIPVTTEAFRVPSTLVLALSPVATLDRVRTRTYHREKVNTF